MLFCFLIASTLKRKSVVRGAGGGGLAAELYLMFVMVGDTTYPDHERAVMQSL